ncbi:MAG: hypothetical protein EPN88_13705 [Bacteroidetes bacterium]|nr:MAG: hypothetical protein EPN88_13705 [Bacteroidota bacterium]
MKFNKLRLFLLLKIFSIFLLVSISLHLIISKNSRKNLFAYFSTRCIDYKQKDYSRKLNDRIVDYSAEAKRSGIKVCRNEKELKEKISEGKLVKVRGGNKYIVDKMIFSFPYLTKEGRNLLDEIDKRFMEKTSRKGLKKSRFHITSMTRKTESIKSLRRFNSNASANSPHVYGNAFDISYKRFSVRKMVLTNCDDKFLKEALAEVIWQLREEKKCWATYEKGQNCFHVVAR